MKRLIYSSLFILFAISLYADDSEVFGTYWNGSEKVSFHDLKLYKELFHQNPKIMEYFSSQSDDLDSTSSYSRIVAEARIAQTERSNLNPTSQTQALAQIAFLGERLLDDYANRMIYQEAKTFSEDDLTSYFNAHSSRYILDDRIKFRMIFKEYGLQPKPEKENSIKNEALKILESARQAPLQFSELARRYSDSATAAKGGDVGWLVRNAKTTNPEFFDRVFAMKKGEISDLIKLPSGFAIIILDDKQEKASPSLDEIRKVVEIDFMKDRLSRLKNDPQYETINLKDAVKKNPDFIRQIQFLENAVWSRYYIESVNNNLTLSDGAVRDFFAHKRRLFLKPQMWEIQALCVRPDEAAISKDRIREHYAIQSARAKAENILEQLKIGESFTTLASQNPPDSSKEKDGYLGWITYQAFPYFSLHLKGKGVGEFIGPIWHNQTFWILKILRIREEQMPSYEEVAESAIIKAHQIARNDIQREIYRRQFDLAKPRIINKK